MTRQHCIESAILEVDYASEQLAFSQQGAFEAFARGRLLAIVDEIFDELSDSDTVVRIDKLEIDLGDISPSYLYDDMESRLRDKIRECLEEQVITHQAVPGANVDVVSRKRSELEVICQFLNTGQVSWNAAFNTSDSLEQLLLRVAERSGRELVVFIARASRQSETITRLASQFSSRTFSKLFATLLKLDAEDIHRTMEDLVGLAGQQPGISTRTLMQQVREQLLLALATGQLVSASLDSLLGEIVATIAVTQARQSVSVVAALLELARGESRYDYLFRALQRLTQADSNLNPDVDPMLSPAGGPTSAYTQEREDWSLSPAREFRQRFSHAVRTGPDAELISTWRQWLDRHAVTIRETIYREGQADKVRRTLAREFTDTMVRDIVVLLEPVHHEYIEKVMARPEQLLSTEAGLAFSGSEARKTMWEFTLTYLIVDRGSRFNKKSYIGSVVRQLAAASNLSLLDLYDSLVYQLQPQAGHDSLREELLSLLLELRDQADDSQSDRPGSPAKNWPRTQRSHSPEAGNLTSEGQLSAQLRGDSGGHQIPRGAAADAFRLALVSGDIGRLRPLWTAMLSDYGDWVSATLQHEGRRHDVRLTMARALPESMLQDVVRLLEPADGGFIVAAIQHDSVIYRRPSRSEQASRGTRTAVWEFTLTYLLVERGTEFNRRSFLTGVIKQIAAHENLSVLSLFSSVSATFGVLNDFSSGQRAMLKMLLEIGRELRLEDWHSGVDEDRDSRLVPAGQRQSPEPSTGSAGDVSREKAAPAAGERPELIRPYLLYERLVTAIAEADSAGSQLSYHVVRLIHELVEQYPWKLHRLNQEVMSGHLSLRTVIKKLPRGLQRKVLLAFFSSFSRRYPFNQLAFERRLDALEAVAAVSSQHLVLLFERLLAQQPHDIESLFAGLESSPDTAQSGDTADQAARSMAEKTLTAQTQPRQQEPAIKQLQPDSGPTRVHTPGESSAAHAKPGPSTMDLATAKDVVIASLQGAAGFQQNDPALLTQSLEVLLGRDPRTLAALLRQLLGDRLASDRLAASVPESLLVKILILLCPAEHFKAVLYADLMTTGALGSGLAKPVQSDAMHLAKWQFILRFLLGDRRAFSELTFVRTFADYLHPRIQKGDVSGFYRLLAEEVGNAATVTTHVPAARISMILENSEPGSESAADRVPADDAHGQRGREVLRELEERSEAAEAAHPFQLNDKEEEPAPLEDIYIDNAGLVILAPYLPRFFDMLGLITGKEFKDRENAERGVHLLQYLLDESTSSFEYQLVLNKLLCGITAGKPIIRGIDIKEAERAAAESLLAGVIANWPILKSTSIAGLRESFIQRQAHLQRKDDVWKLLVESKPYDMLLDELPWSFKTIKFPWMEHPIHVDWR